MGKIKRNCIHCGDTVERYPSQVLNTVYCSKQCRTKHHQENHTILFNCDYCDKKKRIRKANYNNEWKHHFCSKTCKDEWQKEGLKGENNPFYQRKHSYETNKQVSKTKKSMNLTGKKSANYNTQPVKCSECGRTTYKIQYLINRSKYHFCSVKCNGLWKSKHFVGENSHTWNPLLTEQERHIKRKYEDYYVFLKAAMKRDNYTCDICGKYSKRGHGLNVHHLNSYDWDKQNRTNIENGITLCKQCHTDFHKTYGYGRNTKVQYIQFKESI